MKKNLHPATLFLYVLLPIFIIEFAVMIAFTFVTLPYWLETLLDSSILVFVAFVLSYRFIFKPLIEAEQELEKFKLAVDGAGDQIFITSSGGTILYANNATQEITGYSVEEIIGKTPRLWGSMNPPEYYDNLWETIRKTKQPLRAEARNKRKNGQEYTASVHISPILDTKGSPLFFVGIEQDITEQKETDKMKSEFVSLVSHQLRTPLTAINWYTEILLSGDLGELSKAQKTQMLEVYHASQRMTRLVGSFLNVSRIEFGTLRSIPEPVHLSILAAEVFKDLAQDIGRKGLQIERQFPEDSDVITMDSSIARIVLQNLISNAVKYTAEGGTVGIRIFREAGKMHIRVSDTGYGIPVAAQGKIFSKLYRADNIIPVAPDGNGLGLYITKSVLEKIGGSIKFESTEGKGTVFEAEIPVVGGQEKGESIPAPSG
jgi:PAS domain S-box-containing protein